MPNPEKHKLRQLMKSRRAEAHAQIQGAGDVLRDRFLEAVALPAGAIVAGYIAKDNEIDPTPLMDALHTKGFTLALPVSGIKNQPLSFRRYMPGDPLTTGWLEIPEPAASSPLVVPHVVLVPLLAFDRCGYRLGWGGGYYDRTLTALRSRHEILAVGLAFAMQQVPIIPTDSHDARLDKIATEIEVIQILNHS